MAPRPEPKINLLDPLEPPKLIVLPKEEEVKATKRDDIFTRFDHPFGLEQHQWNWIWLGSAHLFSVYYLVQRYTGQIPASTFLFNLPFGIFVGMGTTVGCHRYWTHKTFKASQPLQVLLMMMQSACVQYPIHKWCLDHRVHHKYTDTDADPHNSKRGFWFSHIGWLLQPKTNILQEKLDAFDMSDLDNDPIVRFQSKWFWTLATISHILIPSSVLYYYWDLGPLLCVACCFHRLNVIAHFTFCVNSIAHIWGDKPYDKSISACENPIVSFLTVGEGWHNYHHTFPWDYKTSEFGWKLNLSSLFIDFMAWIGWAWDLKTVSHEMLHNRQCRTGDVATPTDDVDHAIENMMAGKHNADTSIWGWDDIRMTNKFRDVTQILRQRTYQ